jgi:hypothetical protein
MIGQSCIGLGGREEPSVCVSHCRVITMKKMHVGFRTRHECDGARSQSSSPVQRDAYPRLLVS